MMLAGVSIIDVADLDTYRLLEDRRRCLCSRVTGVTSATFTSTLAGASIPVEQNSEAYTPPRKGCERSTQYGLALHCPRRCLPQYQKPTRRFFQCMLISMTETVRARSLSNPRLLPRRPRHCESAHESGPSMRLSCSHQMPRTKTTPNRSRRLTTTSKSSALRSCTTTCVSGRRSPRIHTSSCGR